MANNAWRFASSFCRPLSMPRMAEAMNMQVDILKWRPRALSMSLEVKTSPSFSRGRASQTRRIKKDVKAQAVGFSDFVLHCLQTLPDLHIGSRCIYVCVVTPPLPRAPHTSSSTWVCIDAVWLVSDLTKRIRFRSS